jgi:hypothetical protein
MMRYFIILLLLCSCTKGNLIDDPFCDNSNRYLDSYEIESGNHAARPVIFNQTRYKVGRLKWQFAFGEGCDYVLPGEDQKDWNKAFGLSFDFLDRNLDAAMMGWRWNPDTQKIQVGGYFHDNGMRAFSLQPVAVYDLCEIGECELVVDYEAQEYRLLIWHAGETDTVQHYFTHRKLFSWEINAWFGGNNEAPNDMTIFKQIIN